MPQVRPDHEIKGRMLGVLLVLGSALLFSLSGTLTKLIVSDVWTIVCWRGLIGAVVITLYVLWQERTKPLQQTLHLGWRGWLLASVGSVASVAFVAAFKLTFVANVAIIYATAPFTAALLEWLFLHERLRGITLLAALTSLFGIGIMVFGGLGSGDLTGNAMALLMTLGMALYMVLIRVFHKTPVVLAAAASSLQLFVFGWFVTHPLAVSGSDVYLLLLFGAVFASAAILWTEGTRKIPAAEAGLLGTAETPFAMLFAWLILAELPPLASFIGGGIVLLAVTAHAVRDWLNSRKQRLTTGTRVKL